MTEPTTIDMMVEYSEKSLEIPNSYLTPIKFTGEKHNHSQIWLYRCRCGIEKKYRGQDVKSGRVKTCGSKECKELKRLENFKPKEKPIKLSRWKDNQYYCKTCKDYFDVEGEHWYKHLDSKCKKGYNLVCKIYDKLKEKKYYSNPEKRKKRVLRNKNWTIKNKEHLKIKAKIWRKNNPEKVRKSKRKWINKRKIIDPKFKLDHRMSKNIARDLKGNKEGRSWKDLVGYDTNTLKLHLESLFKPGMTWENYGFGDDRWNIDHKIPRSYFKYTSPEEESFKKCWSLDNLQPMWQIDNFKKSDKLDN